MGGSAVRKIKRRAKQSKQQVKAVSANSGRNFERYVLQRLPKFRTNWRFLTGWIGLMVLLVGCLIVQIVSLGGYYQIRQPVPGGIYTEGVLGSFTNANPIYATNDVDKTVSRLIFSGLFRYDSENHLVGDLARNYSVDSTETIYTVQLRPGLTWHDGESVTAADVAFTYAVIQNPDARSPLQSNWAGIQVAATGPLTVTFTLPNPLSSFIYGMTNGIVPKHILGKVPPVDMRSSGFNTSSPIGAGPFSWRSIDVTGDNPRNAEETIGLAQSESYWRGTPKLKSYVVHAYADQDAMVQAYQKGELTAMAGLGTVPASLKNGDYVESDLALSAATMTFFRTTSGVLQDVAVRKALVAAADPNAVIQALGYPARPVREPLLSKQLGYDMRFAQQTGNPTAAAQGLDAAGWQRDSTGMRVKNGQHLRFALTIADTSEYTKVAKVLQKQWRAAGVDVQISALDKASFQSALVSHDYDAVLYGIAIGADPDVFVYWDSSQADIRSANRLNLSEYNSSIADDSLEAGRTRGDRALRIIKYQAFLQQWQQDAPALGLYQPRYLYISRVKVYGLTTQDINMPSERLRNVSDWMIRTARVSKD